jgi:hypothetical protein
MTVGARTSSQVNHLDSSIFGKVAVCFIVVKHECLIQARRLLHW